MSTIEIVQGTKPKIKNFMNIPDAAEMAGYSVRRFRVIIEEDNVPIMKIGRKSFILTRDFFAWKEGRIHKK